MIDSAVEKREMEHRHAAIQQRVRPAACPSCVGRTPRGHYPEPSLYCCLGRPPVHTRCVPFPRPAHSAGVPIRRGLPTMEQEGRLCGHSEARTGWADTGAAAGTRIPFKARGSLWGLIPWLLLGLHCLLPDSCPHTARGGGGLQAGAAISGSLSRDGCRVGGRAVAHWCSLPSPPFLLCPPHRRCCR